MKCFVIMPFGNPATDPKNARKFESIYSQWIKPAVESVSIPGSQEKIVCHRADKTARPGEIITHIIENLVTSDIVIADLSGRNPNVFYELGARHAVNNNCILIADSLEDIPFDLRTMRTIVYQYEPESMLALKSAIEQAIAEILQDRNRIDNPVRNFLYHQEVEKLIHQSTFAESDAIKNLLFEVSSLRNELNEQANAIRQIMRAVTSPQADVEQFTDEPEFDLITLEGIWKDRGTQSTFYVRIIEGVLMIPYSYGTGTKLTGHMYNCKFFGKTVLGRFEWFETPSISGYILVKYESQNRLTGYWWYKEDMPKNFVPDVSRVRDTIPKSSKLVLQKVKGPEHFPAEAEDYFRRELKRKRLR